ncbi:MAG TPA: hypothetical protein VEX43_07450 [Chthoniobacterales bacterium]|nr:hypothetical protein [Chthoniobacterales bacterium]
MQQTAHPNFRLTVLNPAGRDPEQHFRDGAGELTQPHQPTNFHAYAACTRGSFQRETKSALAEGTPVLLLLRGDFTASERALKALQKESRFVAVSLKETGLHQIAEQLRNPGRLERFVRIVKQADACLAPTPEAADLYRAIRGNLNRVAFIPTPYPIEDARWNFSKPLAKRLGIFIGTREWDVPSRNHLAACLVARELSAQTGENVTVFNFDGRKGARLLDGIGFASGKLRTLDRKSGYPDYLRELARHKIVLQLDTSFVPGQVAGDALLCRVPCVGGNGAIDRLAFPESCGFNRSIAEIGEIAARLLAERNDYEKSVASIESVAAPHLSFKHVAEQLREFFGG